MVDVQGFPPLPQKVKVLYFRAISLMPEPAAEAQAALLARERAGRAVMMDPNFRLDFISDPAPTALGWMRRP